MLLSHYIIPRTCVHCALQGVMEIGVLWSPVTFGTEEEGEFSDLDVSFVSDG